jgi:AcrR family transcriptional regulator
MIEKKEEILQAISQLFFEQGYEKTHIREISNALNITHAGLYYYFKNKQDMLFTIVDDFMEKVLANLGDNLKTIQDPKGKLLYIIRSHIDFFVNYPAQTKVVIYEVHSLDGSCKEAFREKQVEYIAIVKKVLSQIVGRSRPIVDLNVATFSLLGTLNWIVQWYNPAGRVPPEKLSTEIWRFFLKGLGSSVED